MPLYRATSILCSCKYGCLGQQKQLVVGVNDRHIGNNDNNKKNKIIIVTGGRVMRRCFKKTTARDASSSGSSSSLATITGLTATAAAIMLSAMGINAMELPNQQQQQAETLSDIPQMLSSECSSPAPGLEDCKKKARIQRPKSKQAESCTVKCVTTCIRGGLGSPGEGPLNVRRHVV